MSRRGRFDRCVAAKLRQRRQLIGPGEQCADRDAIRPPPILFIGRALDALLRVLKDVVRRDQYGGVGIKSGEVLGERLDQ